MKNQKSGVTILKEIKIFIASSSELEQERNTIKEYINNESNDLFKYNLHLIPELWELKSREFEDSRKQDAFNKNLLESDLVIFMFGKKVGKYTKEEFDLACKSKHDFNKPNHILAYFKNVLIESGEANQNDINNLNEVIDLKKHIDDNLKQVYDTFNNKDELKIKVSNELSRIIRPYIAQSELPHLPDQFIKLFEMYSKIEQGFVLPVRDRIIEDAFDSLHLLYHHNYQPPLSENEFYDRCENLMITTPSFSTIKAISVMLKCEWNDSQEETQFWKANLNATNKKVTIERIFIVKKNESHRIFKIPQIKNHINNSGGFLKSYIIEREYLSEKDPELLASVRDGFLLFDKTALLDKDPLTGSRGLIVTDKDKLFELHRLFDNLKKYTKDLKEYFNDVKLSHVKKEMLSIFVTTKCNLNCSYCFTNKNSNEHKSQTIQLDFVKKGIDDYFGTEYDRHIRFFGAGEPTTEFGLIKSIHEYASKKSNGVASYEMQTNGVFSEDVAIWLGKNINIIWISCDGTPEIQDKHRPCLDNKKSSPIIERNISLMRSIGYSMIGIRATITNENLHKQKDIIKYFSQLGIENIWVDPIFPSVGEKELEEKMDMLEFADEFLDACAYAEEMNVFYGSILTCNFNEEVSLHCRACIPLPHLTTDGFVSACDMALFGEDNNHMKPLIYGQWDAKNNKIIYDDNKINIIKSRVVDNLPECKHCRSKKHCGGYCIGEVLNETESFFGCKRSVCDAIRYLDSKLTDSQKNYKYFHP
jgi:sulfatase maturation enzyme AslB (radical SAM superfamily)